MTSSELDPITAEQHDLATAAHQMDQDIRRIKAQITGLWVQLAEKLYHFRAGEMWRDLGISSFEAWLADPGVELERRWVYKLTDAYKFLVIEQGVDRERVERLKISKVNEIIPALRRGQVDLETALSDAETLGRNDLEIKYRGVHSSTPGQPATGTAVETDYEPEMAICPTCNRPYRRTE
jgi:hypothetical protein